VADDEPVGYLGGAVDDDPYADEQNPYADPYGQAPPDEEVSGYLGGSEGESEVVGYLGGSEGDDDGVSGYLGAPEGPPAVEEYPALPAGDDSDDYSASDLLGSREDDGYGGGEYGYDPAAVMEQADASYFESMGHDGEDYEDYSEPVTDTTTSTLGEAYDEEDDDQPKTISQQDAESIIRRITTKRILPPDEEKSVTPTLTPQLTPTRGGIKLWPIFGALLILGLAAVFVFKGPIGEWAHNSNIPWLAAVLGYKPPIEVPEPQPVVDRDPDKEAIEALKKKMKLSEDKALGSSEAGGQ
jgi:hypothetical protein